DCRDPLEAVDDLRVNRVLDPQRAVLVERRDALLRRHEFRVGAIGRGLNEMQDRLLRCPVIPRWQRIVRRLDVGGYKAERQERSCPKTLHRLPFPGYDY